MLAVTDYFTKWIKAKAFHQVRDHKVKNFIWKNVICHFSAPKEIVTNDSQFNSFEFQDFCKEWGIKLNYSTPHYPQANSQAKSSNKTLKKRLQKAKGAWAIARTPTGETPSTLVYGSEAVIPVETRIPSLKYQWLDDDTN